jgi:hypothetical protein
MKTAIQCWKCGKELKFTIHLCNVLNDLILKVEPCNNLDCRDCSTCDDAHKSKVNERKDERYPKLKV